VIRQIEFISRCRDPTTYLNFFSGSKEVFSLIKLAALLRRVNFGGQRLG
jgi:hypothetical protein